MTTGLSVRWLPPLEPQPGFLARFEATRALHIEVSPTYTDPRIGQYVPALVVVPVAGAVWLGPWLAQERGPCASCLRFWLSLHWWRPVFPAEKQTDIDWTHTEQAVSAAITEWRQTGQLADLLGAMLRIDCRTGAVDRIPFASRRDCPDCGSWSVPAAFDALANPFTGILEDLRIGSEGPTGLSFAHAAAVCPLPARSDRTRWKPLPASGAGLSMDTAISSVLMEAAERHSTLYTGSEPVLRASIRDLPNAEAAALPDPTRISGWVEARTVIEGHRCYVPAAVAYLGYSSPDEPLNDTVDTNGCASGRSSDDALCRALLETIERDALAIWWFNRLRRRGLDPAGDAVTARVEQALCAQGRSLRLVVITTEIQVPVVAAFSSAANGSNIYIGAAADRSITRAARRATIEMMQFLFWGARQDEPAHRLNWLRAATVGNEGWLVPQENEPWPQLHTAPDGAGTSAVAAALGRAGFRPLWIDLTRPHLQIPVVRAIVPGLCALSRRISPSRLFRETLQHAPHSLNPYDPPI